MIGLPFDVNDLHCLGWISEIVVSLVDPPDPRLLEIAERLKTTEALAAWIRSLPQRNDEGDPADGWRVAQCRPAQRLRILAEDPNCVERAALYVAVGELIDPRPVRQLATADYPWGRHTFPLEDGVPIVLDPRVTYEDLVQATQRAPEQADEPAPDASVAQPEARNLGRGRIGSRSSSAARSSSASRSSAAEGNTGIMPPPAAEPSSGPYDYAYPPAAEPLDGPVAIDVGDAIDFTTQLAQRGAIATRNGPSRTYAARNAIQDVVIKGAAPTDPTTIESIGWFFSTAEKVAADYGPRALRIVRTTALAISDLIDDILAQRQRPEGLARNLSLDFGGGRSFGLPSWLTDVGSVAGKIGLNVGALVLAPKLAALGITGSMLELVEQELNSEGLSLGPLKDPTRSFTSALSSLSSRRVA